MFKITLVTDDFSACEERELPDAGAAREEAIRGAVAIGADRLRDGANAFDAEISVIEEDRPGRRFAVSLAASPDVPG